MADSNFEAQRMAELLADINDQLARYGQVHPQTQAAYTDATMKAKYGINDFTKKVEAGAKSMGQFAGAAAEAGKAMLEGKKGAAAFNSAIDGITSGISTVAKQFGPLGKAVAGAAGAYGSYTKAANKMADDLYAGYSKMQKAGGAASDGMSGLFRDAKKLGLSMNELDSFTQIVTENSKDFALLAGSVNEGRKQFASIGESIAPYRASLMAMGISMDEINSGMAGYLKLQSRVGLAQTKTTEQLAEGARKYLLEQDALTRVTGMNRKEQEDAREEIRSQERFAAKLMQVRREQGEEAANQLETTYLALSAFNKKAAQGFADVSTGFLQTEAAQQGFRASQGENMRVAQMVANQQISGMEGAQRIAKANGEFARIQGESLGKMGVYNDFAGDLAGDIRLRAAAEGNFAENYKKQLADQTAGGDDLSKNQAKLIKSQQDANKAMDQFIMNGIVPAQEKMIMFANAAGYAAEKLATISGKTNAGSALAAIGTGAGLGALIGGVPGAAIGAVAGGALYYGSKLIPGAAEGGVLTGPKSGYLAQLHGTEVVIPIDQLGGKTALSSGSTDSAAEDKFAQVRNELLKDNMALAKLTDKQLTDQRRYDLVLSRFQRMSMDQMSEQMDDIVKEDLQSLSSITSASPAAAGSAATSETGLTGTKMSRIVDAAGKVLETRIGGHRNWRNNNPGNIQYGDFAVSMGAIGSDGRFAIFPDMEMGYKAADALMKSKNYQNLTIGDAIKRWAPPSENDTGAYQRSFQKAGFDLGAKYSDMAPAMQRKYLETKMRMEGGQAGQVVSGAAPATTATGPEPHAAITAKGGTTGKPALSRISSKSGQSAMVNADVAGRFQGLIDYLDSVGYDINSLGGYNDRNIAGSNKKSVHARGGAIDINPGTNPMGSQLITDMPADIGAVAAKMGLGWGGNWSSKKDAMHFSAATNEGGAGFSNGGIAVGSKSGYLAKLHGREAVVPLPDGRTIPVSIQGLEDGKMFDTLKSDMGNMLSQVRDVLNVVSQKMDNAAMVQLMDEMVRAQKNSVDIQNKMLRATA